MKRSRSGQHERFSARAVVDEKLGDAECSYYPCNPRPTTTQAPIPTEATDVGRNESIGVLTVKEAAPRLGRRTTEMEGMIARGAVKTLVAGWTTAIPRPVLSG